MVVVTPAEPKLAAGVGAGSVNLFFSTNPSLAPALALTFVFGLGLPPAEAEGAEELDVAAANLCANSLLGEIRPEVGVGELVEAKCIFTGLDTAEAESEAGLGSSER